MKKPQYWKLQEEYRPQVDQVVTVEYRKRVTGGSGYDFEMEDCFFKGELLEVKPQGLCIEDPQHPGGEVFIPFSQIQASRNYNEKLEQQEWEFFMRDEPREINMSLLEPSPIKFNIKK